LLWPAWAFLASLCALKEWGGRSSLHHSLHSLLMAQATGRGAAASLQLSGLQVCDISDLTFDSATEPKEGGYGMFTPE
jgi:hypothetical protein